MPLQDMINALFGGPSWLEQANQQRQKDMANYLQGGVPQLMADTGVGQDLAGGFAGTTTPAKGIRAYHGNPLAALQYGPSNHGNQRWAWKLFMRVATRPMLVYLQDQWRGPGRWCPLMCMARLPIMPMSIHYGNKV